MFSKGYSGNFIIWEENGVDLTIVKSAIKYNDSRVSTLVEKIKEKLNTLDGKNVCVLGLS